MLKTSFQLLHARHNFINALRLWFAETRRLGNPVQDKILVSIYATGFTDARQFHVVVAMSHGADEYR